MLGQKFAQPNTILLRALLIVLTYSHRMATNYILENCNNFFADRKIVMKFEGKDFRFRPTDILKNRNSYKLMYQNVIC